MKNAKNTSSAETNEAPEVPFGYQCSQGNDAFGYEGQCCPCEQCEKKRKAVRRLVDSFSQIDQEYVQALAQQEQWDVYAFPMWNTLFGVEDPCDIRSIESMLEDIEQDEDNDDYDEDESMLGSSGWQRVRDVRLYALDLPNDDFFLGCHSAGHSFYEAYWEPLYNALGYRWHEL